MLEETGQIMISSPCFGFPSSCPYLNHVFTSESIYSQSIQVVRVSVSTCIVTIRHITYEEKRELKAQKNPFGVFIVTHFGNNAALLSLQK